MRPLQHLIDRRNACPGNVIHLDTRDGTRQIAAVYLLITRHNHFFQRGFIVFHDYNDIFSGLYGQCLRLATNVGKRQFQALILSHGQCEPAIIVAGYAPSLVPLMRMVTPGSG